MRVPALKPILLQLHSVAGLVLAAVLVLVALTGAVMSFEDEIRGALDAGRVHLAPHAGSRMPLDALIAKLQAGGDPVASITMPRSAASAAEVRFARKPDHTRPVPLYLDPYTGESLGHPAADAFFATVRKLHRWLLLPGDGNGYGRTITGVAALGLLAMLLTGLVLRWPHRPGSIKVWLKPHWQLHGRGLHRSLHAVIGTWVLLLYLIMTLTGLWWSFDWYKTAATWLLARSPVTTQPPNRAAVTAAPSAAISLDRVWATLVAERGDRFEAARLTLPSGRDGTVRVRAWLTDARDGAHDEFRIDGRTGQILSADIYAAKTIGEKVLARVLDIHRGSIFGWPGQVLFMLAAAAMPLFGVTGVLLYLSRRRHKRMQRAARAKVG
ncbi:PepSY-associated TM helix domain-containing protein [Rhodopseudomonas palustris]|uniref:PepSY-associated TM helix domain-containing protein n=1 Tax=Rhodopseudomonas palustris TaxID=1076 RepID=UPI000E5BF30A|nr:PepSY-associated TM helix domain-containing protein [Rhodopseudomonas palustris]QLH73368.1 PepSY domain-containing protein [Rhodopseudomonas palustris]RHZ92223.1 PepSY domain-containing protein [Rhodopseudomonas palustris]